VCHDSFIYAPWLIYICTMTHSYAHHDSFICETWLCHTCVMTNSYVHHDSFICASWLIHMCTIPSLIHVCTVTHSYVRHDSFIRAPWLGYVSAMTHSYNWWDVWDMVHIWISHDTRMTKSCLTYEWVMVRIWMSHDEMFEIWFIHTWQDPLTCVPWLIHMCAMTH